METRIPDNLEYTIKRSKSQSIAISVERNGTVIVRAPLQTEVDDIERFVSEKRVWIYQKLAKKKRLIEKNPKGNSSTVRDSYTLGKVTV